MQMTVDVFDAQGRLDRTVAASTNALIARGAYEAAIKHLTLREAVAFDYGRRPDYGRISAADASRRAATLAAE